MTWRRCASSEPLCKTIGVQAVTARSCAHLCRRCACPTLGPEAHPAYLSAVALTELPAHIYTPNSLQLAQPAPYYTSHSAQDTPQASTLPPDRRPPNRCLLSHLCGLRIEPGLLGLKPTAGPALPWLNFNPYRSAGHIRLPNQCVFSHLCGLRVEPGRLGLKPSTTMVQF
jgi:hypothetical protein